MRLHVAGIIPIAQVVTDHCNAVPAVLAPVDNGFSAIQKSVYECAMAGCNTIWIVANDDMIPLIRNIVGNGSMIQFITNEILVSFIANNEKKCLFIMFPYIQKIVIVVILMGGLLSTEFIAHGEPLTDYHDGLHPRNIIFHSP